MKKKLLFVDDSLDTVNLIVEIAKIYDFPVDVVMTAEGGLAYLTTSPDAYFFLITDLNLNTGMLGSNLIEKAKAIRPNLRCALYTAYSPDSLKDEDIEIIPKEGTDILELGKMIKAVEESVYSKDNISNPSVDSENVVDYLSEESPIKS